MTTDPTPLQERIARALNDEGWTFEGVHEPGDYDECEDCRRTVAPIAARIAEEVAAEVRKAQADALREYAEMLTEVPDYAPTEYDRGRVEQRHMVAGEIFARADNIEKED